MNYHYLTVNRKLSNKSFNKTDNNRTNCFYHLKLQLCVCVLAYTHTCMHGCMYLCLNVIAHVLELEESLWESCCSFHSVKPKGRIQVIRAGTKCLYPLHHLTNSLYTVIKRIQLCYHTIFPFSKIQNEISLNMSDQNVKNIHLFF